MQVSVYAFNYIALSYAELGIKFYLVAPINLVCPTDSDIFGEYDFLYLNNYISQLSYQAMNLYD